MNEVFGAGNWDRLTFDNAVPSGIFTPGHYQFLFFDGGDVATLPFEAFVNAQRSTLQSWVAAGGSLFLNAARWWDNNPFDLGFGATLNLGGSATGTAVDPSHPIFNALRPDRNLLDRLRVLPRYITGADLTTLIINSSGLSILSEREYGEGHVMLGGLTLHSSNARLLDPPSPG